MKKMTKKIPFRHEIAIRLRKIKDEKFHGAGYGQRP